MTPRRMVKDTFRITIAIAAFSALSTPVLAQGDGESGPPPTPVRVAAVEVKPVQAQRLVTGDLRARRRSLVSAREPGIVIEFPIEEGQRIAKGDTLARLDDATLSIQIDQLEADRGVAQATINERAADLARLEKELTRVRASFEQGASNQKELDDLEGDVAVARARVESAKRSIDVIDARRRLLDKQINDMHVVAPFDGHVISLQTEIGEYLNEGAPVVELIAIDRIEAWLNVPQQHLPDLAEGGRTINVELEAIGRSISTTDYRVLPQVNPSALTFTLIAMLPNDDRHLAPGMSVTAHVPTRQEEIHTLVPKASIEESEGGFFVYTVRESGSGLVATPVRVHILFPRGDNFVVTAADLNEGDRVVIEGNERLLPGASIRVIDPEAVRGPAANRDNASTSSDGGSRGGGADGGGQ